MVLTLWGGGFSPLDGTSQCRWTNTIEPKELECYALLSKSIPRPESDQVLLSNAEDDIVGKFPQATTKQLQLRPGRAWLGMKSSSWPGAFRTLGCNWLQRIWGRVKTSKFDSFLFFYPIILLPSKIGGIYANCWNWYTDHPVLMSTLKINVEVCSFNSNPSRWCLQPKRWQLRPCPKIYGPDHMLSNYVFVRK